MYIPDHLASEPASNGKLITQVTAGPVDGFLVVPSGDTFAAIGSTNVRLTFHDNKGKPVTQFDAVPLQFFADMMQRRGGYVDTILGVVIETQRYNIDGAERVTLELTMDRTGYTQKSGAAAWPGSFEVYRLYSDNDAPDGLHPEMSAVAIGSGVDSILPLVENLSEAHIIGGFDRVSIRTGDNTIEASRDALSALMHYDANCNSEIATVQVYSADLLEALSRGSVQIQVYGAEAKAVMIQCGAKPDAYSAANSRPAAIERAALKLRRSAAQKPDAVRAVLSAGVISQEVVKVANVTSQTLALAAANKG